jgi:FlgD Ig-like domain
MDGVLRYGGIKILLPLILCFSICRAQADSMLVEKTDGKIKVYPISLISEILFSGIPTGVKEKELQKKIISSFFLYQNYPNPFNPSTKIQYTIPSPGDVTVNIYDINGRLVRTLFKSFQDAGVHLLVWDSRNNSGNMVASGAYFCQVLFNKTSLIKKLLLIK